MTEINAAVAVQKEGSAAYSLHGHLPVFQHQERDVRSFRMFTRPEDRQRNGEAQGNRADPGRRRSR